MNTQLSRCACSFPLLLCLLVLLWNARCGAAGYALQFTNNGIQSVGVQFVPELNLYPFTVTAWIKAGGQPSDGIQRTPILSKGNAQSDGWGVFLFNGEIRAVYVAAPGVSYVSDGPPFSSSGLNGGAVGDDQWHHVAFTVDASGGKIYVDGVLRTNTAWVGTPATNLFAQPIFFGHGQSSSAQYVGLLDEVTLWNTALTQAQIQTNKNRLLTGQEPGLIAYYRLDESVGPVSYDSAPAGGTNNGVWNNVTAVISDSPIARLPVVQTLPASSVGGTSATLNGLVNPQGTNASAWFEWGATTNYGNLTPAVPLPAVTNDLSFPQGITGLAVGTTYHFRGVASNGFGVVWGTNASFTTMSGPSVTTLPASAVGATNATLNGSANPNGTASSAWFEWGTTTNYGNLTATQLVGGGNSATNFNQLLNGLPGGIYHFRAVASNSLGITTGANQSFAIPLFSLVQATQPGLLMGSAAWGDFNNDDLPDLLLTGRTNLNQPNVISQLWRNTGNGLTNANIALPGIVPGVWGDYDNDGWLDLLLGGQLWRNTGGAFSHINAGLPAALSGVWGDYDNDGRLDILFSGPSNGIPAAPITQIWRNTSNGFSAFPMEFPAFFEGAANWGDYDNDGRLDVLIYGRDTAGSLWHNNGINFEKIPGFYRGSSWGDYDADGSLDLLYVYRGPVSGPIAQVFRNSGSGFINIAVPFPNATGGPFGGESVSGAGAWGDFDGDGRLDILLTGTTNGAGSGAVCQVWRNTGTGFTNILELPGIHQSAVALADYDNDGRLDIFVTGTDRNDLPVAQLWKNNFPATNSPPIPPTGLSVTATGRVATLHWNAGSDAQTPSAGLSYNVRIGTTPGASDVLAPSAAANGRRRLASLGNAQQGLTAVINYTVGTPYYWSVQAVDQSFAGSSFSAEGNFKILSPAAAVVQAPVTSHPSGDVNGDGLVDQAELNGVLASFFTTSPWLQLTNVAGLGGTNVTFTLTNDLAGAFSVEYTTNLMDWYLLGPAIPRYLFADTNAPAAPQRSYRLRWP